MWTDVEGGKKFKHFVAVVYGSPLGQNRAGPPAQLGRVGTAHRKGHHRAHGHVGVGGRDQNVANPASAATAK